MAYSFFKPYLYNKELFNGKKVQNHYDADISLIIYPLPLLHMLICYNHAEEGLESELNLCVLNLGVMYGFIFIKVFQSLR